MLFVFALVKRKNEKRKEKEYHSAEGKKECTA